MTLQDIAERFARLERRLKEMERVDNPSPITNYVLYSRGTSDQSITADTPTIIDFNNMVSDDYGLVTTGSSWVYTVPTTGLYTIAANVLVTSQTYDAADYVVFYVESYLAGYGLAHIRSPYTYYSHVTHTSTLSFSWMVELYIQAENTISVKLRYWSNDETLAVQADTNQTNVTIFQYKKWL